MRKYSCSLTRERKGTLSRLDRMATDNKISHRILVDFCDWITTNGTESVSQQKLMGWGLNGHDGTYTGSHLCSTGTTLFLSLGNNLEGTNYLSGACAKLTREGEPDDIIRADWRSWAPKEKDRRPHIHINGSRVFIDRECNWSEVRETVIQVMEEELGVKWGWSDLDVMIDNEEDA